MSPMFLNAGVVTVSFAFPLAGALVSASCAIPTSGSFGGVCAVSAAAAIIDRASARSIIGLSVVILSFPFCHPERSETVPSQRVPLFRPKSNLAEHAESRKASSDPDRDSLLGPQRHAGIHGRRAP